MIDIQNIKNENEKIYQAIISQYKMNNNDANNYNESVKDMKLKENTTKAISQARQLKTNHDKQMMDALTANKAEYLAADAEKNKPLEFNEKNAQQLIYFELQRNNKLLLTNSVISNGNISSLEEHLDKHIEDAEVKNMVNSFIKGKSSKDQANYESITSKILQSNVTPLTEIESMLGQARTNEAYPDLVKTDTFGHTITNDFPQKDYFTEKKDFFK